MTQISTLQPWAERIPSCTAIFRGEECIRVKCQNDEGALRTILVHCNVENVLVMESRVRGAERCACVFRNLHALAFGADDDAVRSFGIDDDCVHDPLDWSQSLPLVDAFVGRLPEAAGRSGVERFRMLRILANELRTAIDERNTRVALPRFAGIHAVIDAGARRSVHVGRIRCVDNDAHHV